jgi:hypothetical protein
VTIRRCLVALRFISFILSFDLALVLVWFWIIEETRCCLLLGALCWFYLRTCFTLFSFNICR